MQKKHKHQVLVTGSFAQEGLRKLHEACEVDLLEKPSAEELPDVIKKYDALVICDDTEVNEEIMSAGERLKLIAKMGPDLHRIEIDKATERGITVLHVPERSVISTAEHVMALMLLLARRLPQARSTLKGGGWQKDKHIGVELYGKTLGIVGLGRSGGEVAKRARAFGMHLKAYDPYIPASQAEKLGLDFCGWQETLETSDFISFHVPRSSATKDMIGSEELQLMKRGIRLINCSHAGLINEMALFDAVKEGRVAGAALDEVEDSTEQNPLLQLEEVVITPGLSAFSREAEIKAAVQTGEQVMQALDGEPVSTAVNAPALPPEMLTEVKPFIPLLETMGSFYMQVFGGRIEEVAITYSGKIADYPFRPLTTAFLTGMLGVILGREVNYVNAGLIAEQRGIQVKEVSSKHSATFNNLVAVHVRTEEGTHTLAGTLFENNIIRLVQIGEYRLEVAPSRYMLVTRHIDKPGVVGKIGNILGDTTIASMRLGRSRIGGEAVMVLQVDSPVSREALEKISKMEPILFVSFVEL